MQERQTIRRFASIGIVALALGARAQAAEAQSPVTRVHGIATGLAACWRPAHDDDQVTVRLSFTWEGAVIGEPRIVFAQSSGGRADDAALADSNLSFPRKRESRAAAAAPSLDTRFRGYDDVRRLQTA
jgi:hypothetical protein